jgi:ABC-2 type transport system ATP-binding protein
LTTDNGKRKTENGLSPAVAVIGLSKYFPQIELRHFLTGRRAPGVWALKDAAFELQPGESLCLLGPNGSGKTTLIKLLATLLLPTAGRIFIQGHDALARPLRAKRHLGFITCNEESFYGRLSAWPSSPGCRTWIPWPPFHRW